jgi:hypothetical protein
MTLLYLATTRQCTSSVGKRQGCWMRFQWECTQDPRYGDHLGIDVKAENGRLVVFGAVFRQCTSSLLTGTEYVDDGGRLIFAIDSDAKWKISVQAME